MEVKAKKKNVAAREKKKLAQMVQNQKKPTTKVGFGMTLDWKQDGWDRGSSYRVSSFLSWISYFQ